MVGRMAAFAYGVACYLVFLVSFVYAVGFLGNFGVPKSIDSGPTTGALGAFLMDCALLVLFALQHSIMARPWFKKVWTRLVPPSVERSTYVLSSSLALLLLFWKWEPLGGAVWSVRNEVARIAIWALYAIGWLIVLAATFLINHFDLFGLRQAWLQLIGREYKPIGFRTPGPYRLVRHPLYVGWLMVFWSTPEMTAARLVFAMATTAYILVAIQLEEGDLMQVHSEYADYRRKVPMLLPGLGKQQTTQPTRTPARQPG